jgi:hypothetical protein
VYEQSARRPKLVFEVKSVMIVDRSACSHQLGLLYRTSADVYRLISAFQLITADNSLSQGALLEVLWGGGLILGSIFTTSPQSEQIHSFAK